MAGQRRGLTLNKMSLRLRDTGLAINNTSSGSALNDAYTAPATHNRRFCPGEKGEDSHPGAGKWRRCQLVEAGTGCVKPFAG